MKNDSKKKSKKKGKFMDKDIDLLGTALQLQGNKKQIKATPTKNNLGMQLGQTYLKKGDK